MNLLAVIPKLNPANDVNIKTVLLMIPNWPNNSLPKYLATKIQVKNKAALEMGADPLSGRQLPFSSLSNMVEEKEKEDKKK